MKITFNEEILTEEVKANLSEKSLEILNKLKNLCRIESNKSEVIVEVKTQKEFLQELKYFQDILNDETYDEYACVCIEYKEDGFNYFKDNAGTEEGKFYRTGIKRAYIQDVWGCIVYNWETEINDDEWEYAYYTPVDDYRG